MKRAVILGLGLSGVSAAKLLCSEGRDVVVIDAGRSKQLSERAGELKKLGVSVRLGAKSFPAGKFDLCVASPGFKYDSPWLQEARKRGIPVESEIETAFCRCGCPVIAVTGSNGKSTFAKVLADMLCAGGLRAAIAGNYGIAFSDVVASGKKYDWIVVEVSSFQLETIRTFRPKIAVLLNIQANHLDRHSDMDEYIDAKCRIFENMQSGDLAIVGSEVAALVRERTKGKPDWSDFGDSGGMDCAYEPGRVRAFGSDPVAIDATFFDNRILGPSLAAALGVAVKAGVRPVDAGRALREFKPLPHRMEPAGSRDGIMFINNSKATTLSSLAASLEMCGGNARLIAGGLLKEKDLDCVKIILEKSVKGAYLIGQCAEAMKEAWDDCIPCRVCGDLKSAVKAAWKDAKAGECILLAPGCASFDQFRNFEDRGDKFKKIVSLL